MPKRSRNLQNASNKDVNILARSIVDAATEEKPAKNPAAVLLGQLGGLKGGPARARKLSARKRKEIAKKAARARWRKPD